MGTPEDSMHSEMFHKMCVQQGYVPKGCTLDGALVWVLVSHGNDPCTGCHEGRSKCGGRPRKIERQMDGQ